MAAEETSGYPALLHIVVEPLPIGSQRICFRCSDGHAHDVKIVSWRAKCKRPHDIRMAPQAGLAGENIGC